MGLPFSQNNFPIFWWPWFTSLLFMPIKIKKILIAVDDSPTAMHAADYGIGLAQLLDAKIGVVTVSPFSMGNIEAGITPDMAQKVQQKIANRLLDEVGITHPNVQIEEFNPIGNVKKEILNIMELWNPDLTVVGHHTHGALGRLFGASTEEKLLAHLKRPLLIIPHD